MEAFVLVVRLYAGGPIVAFPVKECIEGVPWIIEARVWAERSGLNPITGPMYACLPAQSPYAISMVRK